MKLIIIFLNLNLKLKKLLLSLNLKKLLLYNNNMTTTEEIKNIPEKKQEVIQLTKENYPDIISILIDQAKLRGSRRKNEVILNFYESSLVLKLINYLKKLEGSEEAIKREYPEMNEEMAIKTLLKGLSIIDERGGFTLNESSVIHELFNFLGFSQKNINEKNNNDKEKSVDTSSNDK
jgi:hypothetical protein